MDEVTAAPDVIRQPLFATIRAMCNKRVDITAPPEGRDVVFVFAGTFDPERMIVSKNSPFNIAQDFDTSKYDFSLAQIGVVAANAGVQGIEDEVLSLTSGHPYLTNRLISLAAEGFSLEDAQNRVLAEDSNLRQIGNKVRRLPESVVELARRIAGGEDVPCTLGLSEGLDHLIVLGVIKPNANGTAVIRCQLYERFLDLMTKVKRKSQIGF